MIRTPIIHRIAYESVPDSFTQPDRIRSYRANCNGCPWHGHWWGTLFEAEQEAMQNHPETVRDET